MRTVYHKGFIMLSQFIIGILIIASYAQAKQILFDDKAILTSGGIKLKDLSNIEHLDNTLRTYQNFARKCRICEFPESYDEFVCKETPCRSEEDLARHPLIKKIKSPEACERNKKHENSCAFCICDSSGQFMDCTVTKTVPLCLLYVK